MNNNFIFELSVEPVSLHDRIESWDLSHHFYPQNPYWSEEGEPLDVSDRQDALDCLKHELPQGYSMNLVDETINIINPDLYLTETINRFFSA